MKRGATGSEGAQALVPSLRRLTELPAGHGRMRIVEAAAQLGTSVRSLQRWLKRDSLSYSDLLDRAYQELAKTLLTQGQLGIAEIGRRLGYRDPSSFSRAFLRWTGMSPRQYRAKARQDGGAEG